ncbi:MAG: retention module-containing protein, partial [Pseudomonas sp.]|uniref:retention module-containing protein n=1 Tax=Pseudomonas sp. TaxID=306 RepID=UPI003D151095
MSSVVAIVKQVVGQVVAVSPEGIQRVLIEGDRLFIGDQVLTGLAGAITLELNDGRLIDLGRETQWSADAPDSTTDLEEATAQAAPSVEELQQAIAAGADPTQDLEATAAGPQSQGSGAPGGGHSVVMLDAVAGEVAPTVGYETAGLNFGSTLNREFTGAPATTSQNVTGSAGFATVSLWATPFISEDGGDITYTAILTTNAWRDTNVHLSNGQVIVIPMGLTSGSVTVTIPGDNDVYLASDISATITGTSGGRGGGFSINITPSTVPAVTMVGDSIDTTVVNLSASPSVVENGLITYTASVTAPVTVTPVVVTLSNGQAITIPVGSTSGSIELAVQNDVYNSPAISTAIIGLTGGNYENLVPNETPAVTTVVDVVDTTTVSLTGSSSVTEGASITYTASISSEVTGTPVLVTLSTGQTITIPVGATSGSLNVYMQNDGYKSDPTVINASITALSGGNFEKLTADTTPVSTVLTDVPDTVYAVLWATNSAGELAVNVAENEVITYTAAVWTPVTGSPVIVTLSNGLTITIPVGGGTGSVSVVAPNDVYNGASPLSVTITSVSGGNFEGLTIYPMTAVTNIIDSIDTTTVSLEASPNVVANDPITYTANVTAPVTGTPVVVTLSNGQTITIPVGSSSGSVQLVAPNDGHASTTPISAMITGVTGGNYENLVANPIPAVTLVTAPLESATVSLSATDTLIDQGMITYTASVTSPVTGAPVVVTLSNGLTITIPEGASRGTAVIQGPTGDVYGSSGFVEPVSATITSVTGGNYAALTADPTPAVTRVVDLPNQTFGTLSGDSVVLEGATASYTVTLSNPTQTPMTLTLSNGLVINIGAGQISGTASLIPAPNDVYDSAQTQVVSIQSYSGGNFEAFVPANTVETTIVDSIDTTVLRLTATPSVMEGGIVTYTAVLTAPAQTEMTITLSNSDVITIEAGQSSGSISYTVPNDRYVSEPISLTIFDVSGGNFEGLLTDPTPAVSVVVDTPDASALYFGGTTSVSENGTITYTVSVTSQVMGTPLIINLSNGQTITIPVGGILGRVQYQVPNDVYNSTAPITTTITSISGGNYEQLIPSPWPVVTNVTDIIDVSTVSLGASPSVTENGVISYTASVTSPVTGTPVIVSLSNGQTITIPVGGTSGSVQFTAPNDVYAGATQFSTTIIGTTGGNFESLVANPTPAVTTITDSIDTSSVSLTATPSVTEGGVLTYTATVSAPVTGTPVTVNLANGQTIVIAVGQTSASVDFIAPNNVTATNAALSNSITSVSGGNFEQLVADSSTVTTVVTDDPAQLDVTGLSLTATGTVAEGGSIVYTATLTNPAGTEMKIALSNGETITIAKGATEGSITFAAPANTVYVDGANVSVTVIGTTGGDFEALAVTSTPAVTAVSDTTDISTVTLTATASAVEGGVVTYTASVSAPVTGSNLIVTLANGQTITIPVNASSGSVDFIAPNNVLNTNTPLTNSITGVTGGNYEQLDTAGTPTTVVTDDPARLDTTGLTLSATGTVAEGGSIVYTATLTNPAGTEMKIALSNGETITIAKDATQGSITFAAPANTVYVDGANVSVTITGTTGGDFEHLEVSPTAAVTAVTDTTDVSTVTLTATASAVEGGIVTYTASVSAPVTGTALVISLANGQSITIPVNASSGSVDFIAPNNVLNTNTPLTNSITGVTGGNYEQLDTAGTPTTVVTDDPARLDTTGLTLSATGTVAEGGSIVYTATLTNPAGTEMKIALSNGETITIAKDATQGSITFAAPANTVYVDGANVSVTITGTTGGDFEHLEVSPTAAVTAVTDTTDISTVTLTATASAVEGGIVTYTASVTSPVTGTALVISLANGQSITIPVNASSGSVDFIAPNNVLNTNTPLTNSITGVSGGNYEQLDTAGTPTTVVTDDPARLDTTGLTLSATGTVAEGGSIVYTATLTNPAGTEMKVALSNGETITIAKDATQGSITFAAPANTVYVDGANVSVTITGTTGGDFEHLEVSPTAAVTAVTDTTDVSTVTLTATASAVEGGIVTYTASVTSPVTGTALVISLANGQSITIPVNASSGSVDFIAPNNVLNTNTPLTNSIIGVTGGNYEQLDTAGTPTTVVTDDPTRLDTTGLTLSATGTVAEGGSIVYTATLTNPAGTEMKIALSNGETITIAKDATQGSITFAAPANTVYVDGANVSVTITGTTGGDFEHLEVSPTAAVTAVTDTTDVSTVTLTATASVVEGGVVTYTASVTAPVTGAPLVISLANGQSITIPVNASSGSVDFIAPNNVLNTNTPLTNSITGTTGGNYEQLDTAGTPTTVVTDDPARLDTTGLTLNATGTVAEGGSIVYTATLTNPAGTEMKIALSNGETITIAKDATQGSITFAAPANTVYVDGANVSVTITGTTGGDFEHLEVSPTAAVTAVTDTTDVSTVTLTATASAVEGGIVTYTASVSAPVTGTALVISLANGQSITIPVNASSGSVDFIAPNNVLNTNTPLTNSITGVTGGNYEQLDTAGTPTTVVTDDPARLDTTGLTLSATGTVAEGGSIVYTATLTNPAGTEMKIALSNGETITIAKDATQGSITFAAPANTVYVDGANVSVTITGTTGGDFEHLEVSPTAAVTAVTDTTDVSTVTLTATASAVEGGIVTYTASVTSPVTGAPLVISLANGQSITIPVNASSGSVDFIAPNNVLNTNTPLTNSITGVTGGNYEQLDTAGTPTTVVTDDPARLDTTGLTLSATGTVAEGGSIVYTATLTNPAGTEMKIALSNGETITIAKDATQGSITFAAPANTVYVDGANVSVTITGTTGGDFEHLEVSPTAAVTAVTDTTDVSTVTLTATASAVEGGVVTYTASVTAPVIGAPLVISLANGQSITIPVNASSGSVDFIAPNNVLNTNTPLTNSITGVSGGNYEQLDTAGTPTTVVTDDPARLDTTGLTLSATGTVAEGGSIVYTATLTNPAGTEMKIALSNGETITIAKDATQGSITFAAPANTVYVDG